MMEYYQINEYIEIEGNTSYVSVKLPFKINEQKYNLSFEDIKILETYSSQALKKGISELNIEELNIKISVSDFFALKKIATKKIEKDFIYLYYQNEDKEFFLSIDDAIDLAQENKILFDNNTKLALLRHKKINEFISIQPKRKYNKKEKIMMLYKEYHSDCNTKKEVFKQISKKLKITVKAVEKAYYGK